MLSIRPMARCSGLLIQEEDWCQHIKTSLSFPTASLSPRSLATFSFTAGKPLERAREREKTERERAQERERARETELCTGDDVSYFENPQMTGTHALIAFFF
jgi:hypothetical protein